MQGRSGQASSVRYLQMVSFNPDNPCRERTHKVASALFDVTLVVYLLLQFLCTVGWSNVLGGSAVLFKLTSYFFVVRWILFLLALEKFTTSWKRGLITIVLLVFSWYVSRPSHAYNNVFDFMAFLCLSDLGEERKTLRLNLASHIAFLFMMTALVFLGRTSESFFRTSNESSYLIYGFAHLNTTGAFLLSVLLLIWALWMKQSRIVTFAVFWAFAYPVNKFLESQTVAALLFLFEFLHFFYFLPRFLNYY